MGFVLRKNKDSFFLGRAELPREPALCMLAVIIKNPKRRASFLVFLRGKFSELLLGKLSLNVDNNAGAYYEDRPLGCSCFLYRRPLAIYIL